MTEQLQRAKKLRTGHRSSTTRLINQTYDTLKEREANGPKLKQQETSLKEKLDTLRALDAEILNLLSDEEDIGNEIEQADTYREKVQLALCDIQAVLKTTTSLPPLEPPVLVEETSLTSTTFTKTGKRTARVKLPKIVLKRFDGNPLQWATFWDSFSSTVHDNPELTPIDKFNYLNSLLDREAADAVSGLALTSVNYDEAISILQKRFGDRQQIVSKHMETLLNLEPVTTSGVRALRHLYDKVEAHIRSLRALGISNETYGSLLTSTLLGKLPADIRLIVSRSITDDDWSLDKLMITLGEEIEARERVTTTQVNTTPHHSHKKPRDVPTARTMFASNTCTYCDEGHSSNSCTVVTDVESRKQVLKKCGRCFNCLRKNHLSRECRSTMRCHQCHRKHHTSICDTSRNTVQQGSIEVPMPVPAQTTTTTIYTDVCTPVLLQTARAFVVNPDEPKHRMEVRLIFDGGSQRSYITHRVRKALGLFTEAVEAILLKTFGSQVDQAQACDVVRIAIETRDGRRLKIPLLSVSFICDPLVGQTLSCAIDKHPHLTTLDLADSPRSETGRQLSIDILIGADNYWNLVTGEIIRHENSPTAIKTHLGWVLSGPLEAQATNIAVTALHVSVQRDLETTLKRFWDLETLGIKAEEEESLYDKFVQTITFKENRYEVQLPWRECHPPLPSNYQLSMKRLTVLLHKLRRDPTLMREYDAVIRDQLDKGIIEIVEEPESGNLTNTHYIPHHAVVRRDKQTTKLRIVFDASAKSTGPSLNECLYAGPPLSCRIFEILLRFRIHRIGLIGDIEKAFLMISVKPADRDALRFLWVDDISKDTPIVVTLRFRRVMFGVSSSPFLLNGTIKYHIERYQLVDPEFVTKFLHSIYVDDVIFGAPCVEEGLQLYLNSKQRLGEGGFNLRQFTSNSPQLRELINEAEIATLTKNCTSITEEDESYAKITLGDNQEISTGEQKVLGVCWDYMKDRLMFDIRHIAEIASEEEPTKRGVVSVSARFYDPLGVLSPCIVLFKLLLQSICEAGLDWDEPLSGDLLSTWEHLLTELKNAPVVFIPRCYLEDIQTATSYSLRGFCDASSKAYAAVVYLRIETPNGIKIRFVASKTRAAPFPD